MIAGAIISAVAGLGSTVIGQIAAEKKMQKAREELDKQSANIDNWYNNSLGYVRNRADIQELGRQVRESVRERNAMAENPVSQNTTEGEAALREQNASDISSFGRSAVSSLAGVQQTNEEKYLNAKNNISSQRSALATNQAQQITNAAGQLTNSMVNVAGKFVDSKGSGKAAEVAAATRAKASDPTKVTAEENKAVVNDLVGGQAAALGSYDPDEGDYAPFKSMFGN